jgi:hypothetical protein
MRIEIKGRPRRVSREFVRAWCQATVCVLSYHNRPSAGGGGGRVEVKLIDDLAQEGGWSPGEIALNSELGAEMMATTIVHELVHECCGNFGEGTEEKCTSTLTARLKPLIKPLAESLMEHTYRVAAYLAHTRMSYRTDTDHYDPAEDRAIGVVDRRKRT